MTDTPDTPHTLLDELARDGAFDDSKWRQFDELYRPVVAFFLLQRFPSLAGDCDDLVQDVMVKLVEQLRKGGYERDRGRFRTWLAAIVHNLAADKLRRMKRFAEVVPEDVDWFAPQMATAREQLDRQWDEARYRAARHHVLHHVPLPPHYAETFRALEKGASPREIARRFGVAETFVRQAKHRVSEAISAMLRDD